VPALIEQSADERFESKAGDLGYRPKHLISVELGAGNGVSIGIRPLTRELLTSCSAFGLRLHQQSHLRNMPRMRILLTGADGLIGSHILAQLLSYNNISVRALVGSREAVSVLQHQYSQGTTASLDVSLVPGQDLSVPGVFGSVLADSVEPFAAVVHTLVASSSDDADCLARFINLENDMVIGLLRSIQEAAPTVTRVVIVTSLTPFARWLVGPGTGRNSAQFVDGQTSMTTIDTSYVLATSQASDNIVYDSITRWLRKSGARFDVTYVTAPNVYGPTVYPLETSTDLSEANRRIWDICSNEPSSRTEMSPSGIDHFLDVRVSRDDPRVL
tara:strand:- start:12627 stop:13616 length:990 start_codon:yes stop_codon:yes gene_type:complete